MQLPVNARIATLSLLPKASVGVEIGVHKGAYSRIILDQVKPRRLHLVDPWKHFESPEYSSSLYGGLGEDGQSVMDKRFEDVKRSMTKELSAGTVVIHRSLSNEAAAAFDRNSLDFVYIDGDHSYEGVSADIDAYFPLVKSGGFIILDDYVDGKWWGDGVIQATHELLASQNCKIAFMMDEQVVIRKR